MIFAILLKQIFDFFRCHVIVMLFLPFRIVECLASDIVNKHLELYCVTCSLIASMHLLTVALISSFIVFSLLIACVVCRLVNILLFHYSDEFDRIDDFELRIQSPEPFYETIIRCYEITASG